MKVVHISTKDTGGAAVACIRLHLALLNGGYDSTLLTLKKERHDIANHYLYKPSSVEKIRILLFKGINKIKRILKLKKDLDIKTDSFSFPQSFYYLHKYRLIEKADIINLHWISGFWDYRSFSKTKNKKIVWTLHDMNPFTGGCHYSDGCNKYQNDCSVCPFVIKANTDITKDNLNYKREYLFNNIRIVSPSEWLKNCSQSSKLFCHLEHFHVFNTITPNSDSILTTSDARTILKLPQNKNIMLFVADSIKVKRKGFEILRQALLKIDPNNFLLLIVGDNKDIIKIDFPTIFLGYIGDAFELSTLYTAADTYIIPSLEDNLPNTILEALINGTPVICFNVGGAKDLILNYENGLISDIKSPESLSEMIISLFDNKEKFVRSRIRTSAIENLKNKVIVDKYIEIYNS